MIRIFEVKCAQDQKDMIEAQLIKKLNIRKKDLLSWSVHRRSVDARGHKVSFSFTIDAQVKKEARFLKRHGIQLTPDEKYYPSTSGNKELKSRPIVVGFGPAGMFAALILAQAGYQPLVIERGSAIEKRQEDVNTFWKEGILNPESNVQFGEGGAGAFSDGKLTTRSKDGRARKVLEELVNFGGNPDILVDQHPHIGTDAFVPIIQKMRNHIMELGGKFLFDTQLEDIEIQNGKVVSICASGKRISASAVILAIGHSATDTIRLCKDRGLEIENKAFAVGVRIEHRQSYINEAMLKEYSQDERFIPARYQVTHTATNKKGVYSFCMCPGGYVIPASSSAGKLVVNGMSYAARDNHNANSALLVQVNEKDYGKDILSGIVYQETLEEKAYQISQSYKAPVQLARDYL